MSVDLTFVLDPYEASSWASFFGYVRLPLKRRDTRLYNVLTAASVQLPVPMDWYEDEGLRKIETDPYGKPLRVLQAGLAVQHLENVKDLSEWDEAVLAFLKALPTTKPVVLYFH